MICDACAKQKATVHLTEIINDQVTKLNLCEYCAKKKGTQVEQHFGIADLLQGLTEQPEKNPTAASSPTRLKCTDCGMTFSEFKRIGRLGCASCYSAFAEPLMPLLKRIHGSNKHAGKQLPPEATRARKRVAQEKAVADKEQSKAELIRLKLELKKAITNEQFEEAAAIRDKIKQLEKSEKLEKKEAA